MEFLEYFILLFSVTFSTSWPTARIIIGMRNLKFNEQIQVWISLNLHWKCIRHRSHSMFVLYMKRKPTKRLTQYYVITILLEITYFETKLWNCHKINLHCHMAKWSNIVLEYNNNSKSAASSYPSLTASDGDSIPHSCQAQHSPTNSLIVAKNNRNLASVNAKNWRIISHSLPHYERRQAWAFLAVHLATSHHHASDRVWIFEIFH